MEQQVEEGRREGGREVMTEEGKEGDKAKECRETTGPLFLLKELPHHSVLWGGGVLYFCIRRGLTDWPAKSNQVGQSGSFQNVARMPYSDMETMSVNYLAQQFIRVFLSKSFEQTTQQRLLYSCRQKCCGVCIKKGAQIDYHATSYSRNLTHPARHPHCEWCLRTSICSCQPAALPSSAWALGARGLDGGPHPGRARRMDSQAVFVSRVHPAR